MRSLCGPAGKTNTPKSYWAKVFVSNGVKPRFVLEARAVAVRVLFILMSVGLVSPNVWPTGVRRLTESWPDVKDRKFVRMLKLRTQPRH